MEKRDVVQAKVSLTKKEKEDLQKEANDKEESLSNIIRQKKLPVIPRGRKKNKK